MTENGRESFIFYHSFYDAICDLDDDTQLQIYKAIAEYSFTGKEPKITGIACTIFKLIKPQLEANYKRYLNGKKSKREANGKQKESKTEAKKEQTGSKTGTNVNVNVNKNVNVNNKQDLSSYERLNGELTVESILPWVEKNNLDAAKVKTELSIFRNACLAKNYKYANFERAFYNWVQNDKYGNGIVKFKKKIQREVW